MLNNITKNIKRDVGLYFHVTKYNVKYINILTLQIPEQNVNVMEIDKQVKC